MLISKLPDGSTVFEVRGDQFADEWKAATPEQRVVLSDKRPAVRREDSNGVSYVTVHPKAWDVICYLKRHDKLTTIPRRRQCDFCHSELKVAKESDKGYWVFTCPNCKSTQIDSKSLIGGTMRGGDAEKT